MKKINKKKKKGGFFKRIIGAYDDDDFNKKHKFDDDDDDFEDELYEDDDFDDDDDEEKDFDDNVDNEDEEEFDDDEEEESDKHSIGRVEGLSIDLINKSKQIIAKTHVPGVEADDISIEITRENLSIEIESREEYIEEKDHYICQEIFMGKMKRSETLPEEIDVDNVTSELKNGVLTIIMPKLDKKKKAKISIKKK